MDPRSVSLIVIAGCAAAVMTIKIVLDAVLRMRELRASPEARDIAVRLEQIQLSIDAVAAEMERHGERQRFAERPRAPEIVAGTSRTE